MWDLRKINQEKGKKKKKKLKNPGGENPYLMLRIDKTLAFQNKVLEVTNKIIEFRKNEKKTKEDIKNLWYVFCSLELENNFISGLYMKVYKQ